MHGLSSGEQTEGDRGEALVLRAVLELLLGDQPVIDQIDLRTHPSTGRAYPGGTHIGILVAGCETPLNFRSCPHVSEADERHGGDPVNRAARCGARDRVRPRAIARGGVVDTAPSAAGAEHGSRARQAPALASPIPRGVERGSSARSAPAARTGEAEAGAHRDGPNKCWACHSSARSCWRCARQSRVRIRRSHVPLAVRRARCHPGRWSRR